VSAYVGSSKNLKDLKEEDDLYRGTSIIRNPAPLGPYRRTMPRALGGS